MLCWHRRFADCIFFRENKNEIFEAIKYSSLTGPVIAPRTIDKNKVIISIRRHQFRKQSWTKNKQNPLTSKYFSARKEGSGGVAGRERERERERGEREIERERERERR